jgi:putative transposase
LYLKKGRRLLGCKRGQLTSSCDCQHILLIIEEACKAGAKLQACCSALEISKRTIERWSNNPNHMDKRMERNMAPHNKLSAEEEKEILQIVNETQYADATPAKIVPMLADRGT